MAYVIGKKSDNSIVELSRKTPEWELTDLQNTIKINYGGEIEDYSFYQLSEAELEKINDGQSNTLVWASGEITGYSFALEDGKPYAKVSTSKETIDNDGIDSTTINVEIWKTDLSELDTSIQFPGARVPILTPKGVRYIKFDIVDGLTSKVFKTTEAGTYVFPAVAKRYNDFRIFNQVTIEVDQEDLLE